MLLSATTLSDSMGHLGTWVLLESQESLVLQDSMEREALWYMFLLFYRCDVYQSITQLHFVYKLVQYSHSTQEIISSLYLHFTIALKIIAKKHKNMFNTLNYPWHQAWCIYRGHFISRVELGDQVQTETLVLRGSKETGDKGVELEGSDGLENLVSRWVWAMTTA